MKTILDHLSGLTNAWSLIDLTLITFFAWLSFFYRQTWKKQSLIDSHMVARNITRINNQGTEIELLKNKNKELSILLDQKRTFADELKKSFEQAVAEIKKLKTEKELLESCNQDNLKLITHLRERALHQKHTKKVVVEATEWKCIDDEGYFPSFQNGNDYKTAPTQAKFNKETTLCLFSENDVPCLVEKQYFTPVKT